MGTLAWQLNDCWPVQSWAWIDHALRPKAVWYAAKRFYAPLLLSLWSEHGEATVRASLVNDAVDGPRSGRLTVEAFGRDGSVVWTENADVSVDAATSAEVFSCDRPGKAVLLHATFEDVESTLLLVEPKDLVLPAADLQITVTDAADGASTVTLEASTPVLSVMLWLDGADATWSDNVVHVLPGRAKTIVVRPSSEVSVGDRLRWRALR
jgi:beta-mannosidase